MEEFTGPEFEELRESIHAALRNWGSANAKALAALGRLQILRNTPDAGQAGPGWGRASSIYTFLEVCLKELETQHKQLARLLRCRFLERETILYAAHQFNLSEDQVNRRQRRAIEALAGLIHARERELRRARAAELWAGLPPAAYHDLVGMEEILGKLLETLRRPDPPWLVALSGLGGSGKTALTGAAARQLIPEFAFDHVIWVACEYEADGGEIWGGLMTALGRAFAASSEAAPYSNKQVYRWMKARPQLVVLDGAEAALGDMDFLFRLRSLAEPSKFLLNARRLPPNASPVHRFSVPPLDLQTTGLFLQQRAAGWGEGSGAEKGASNAEAIYRVVGGHPGALVLAIDLLTALPLERVLAAYQEGTHAQVAALYQDVFGRPWEALSDAASRMLRAWAEMGDGDMTYEDLAAASRLGEPELGEALGELVDASLVQRSDSLEEPTYNIATLTRTYLRSGAGSA